MKYYSTFSIKIPKKNSSAYIPVEEFTTSDILTKDCVYILNVYICIMYTYKISRYVHIKLMIRINWFSK